MIDVMNNSQIVKLDPLKGSWILILNCHWFTEQWKIGHRVR